MSNNAPAKPFSFKALEHPLLAALIAIILLVGGALITDDPPRRTSQTAQTPTLLCSGCDADQLRAFNLAQQDLAAQQSMAESTNNLVNLTDKALLLSWFSLVLSIVGVTLVGWNLVATRATIAEAKKANRIAKDSAEMVNRAWLQITEMGRDPKLDDQWKACVFNHGVTPAINVKMSIYNIVSLHDSEQPFSFDSFTFSSAMQKYDEAAIEWMPATVFPKHKPLEVPIPYRPIYRTSKKPKIYLICSIQYQTPYNKTAIFQSNYIFTVDTTKSDRKPNLFLPTGIKDNTRLTEIT